MTTEFVFSAVHKLGEKHTRYWIHQRSLYTIGTAAQRNHDNHAYGISFDKLGSIDDDSCMLCVHKSDDLSLRQQLSCDKL